MARKKSLDRLLAALESPDAQARSVALGAFHYFDWRSTRPSRRQRDQAFHALAAVLAGDPDQGMRGDAARALTFWFEPRATDALLLAAERDGESAAVRGQAIEGIGNTLQCARPGKRLARVIPKLLAWLRDPAVEVRFWSVYAVGVLVVKEARPLLEELARTDDAMFENWWRVRDEAADALASWDGGEWPDRDPAWLTQATPGASA